ncbi:MAG: glycosyltransferase [Desulfobacterales bacterium]
MNELRKPLPKAMKETRPILEDITIVIPTLGRPILENCLYWIASGSAWPGGLVVVDQGSNPQARGWVETLKEFGIDALYLPSGQRGRASGINRGLTNVKTRFAAITDDDCFVAAEWIEIMAKLSAENSGAILTGRIEAAGEGVPVAVTSQVPAAYRYPRLTFDSMSGGNMGTSMSVFDKVGPFDESSFVRTAEDAEWAYRALRAGVPIIYAPELVVRHFGWRDDHKRLTQIRDYARSHGGFYGKYLRKGDAFIAVRAMVHHGRALRWWLRGMMTKNRPMAFYGWAYLTGLLPGIIAGMRKGGAA